MATAQGGPAALAAPLELVTVEIENPEEKNFILGQ
jgi:hypothetical protein